MTTTEHDPARLESALLYRVLDLHPARLTTAELSRDLAGKEAGIDGDRESIETAIGNLTAAGLLHPADDGFVSLTRAAVRLGELLPPTA